MKKRWLQDWPWETVVAINAALCKEKNALHKPTTDGYQPAQKLWEEARRSELTLREAEARRLGARRLFLAVNKHNVKAVAAYQRNGFMATESVVTNFGNGFVMDDFIMTKALAADH